MIRVFHGQNDILIPFELGTKTNMADRLSFAYLYGYLQKNFIRDKFQNFFIKV